jgi:GTP-binding protein HflX
VLDEIGVQDLPMITAWNKVDACANPAAVRALAASRSDVVAVSGATGEGLAELLELVAVKLAENMVDMQVGGWTRFVCLQGLCGGGKGFVGEGRA